MCLFIKFVRHLDMIYFKRSNKVNEKFHRNRKRKLNIFFLFFFILFNKIILVMECDAVIYMFSDVVIKKFIIDLLRRQGCDWDVPRDFSNRNMEDLLWNNISCREAPHCPHSTSDRSYTFRLRLLLCKYIYIRLLASI